MSEINIPLKVCPSTAKLRKNSLNLQACDICQNNTLEQLARKVMA